MKWENVGWWFTSWWYFFRYGYWCCLSRGYRYFWFRTDWYDGPIWSFGFWWFHYYSFGYNVDKTNEAFRGGWEAFKGGKSLETCPHRRGQYRETWINAWNLSQKAARRKNDGQQLTSEV